MTQSPKRAGAAQAGGSSRFLDACARQNRSAPPLWIMRQAGRYLPEYQELRKRHSFARMCSDPDLAAEASLQPYRRFRFDAVVVFYDILFILEAMGAPLEFTEEGPVIHRPVRGEEGLRALHEPDVFALAPRRGTGAVLETIRRVRAELPQEVAVLGFAGAPFTLAAYLVEGSFQRTGDRMRRLIHEDPQFVRALLDRISRSTEAYVRAQAEAGADAVQLFDTWAGVLGAEEYREFALPYQRSSLSALSSLGIPTILYVNGCAPILEEMASSGAAVLSIDWRVSLSRVRNLLGPGLGLQGNLDPAALFQPPEGVRRSAARLLDSMSGDPAYVVNLGHGILPDTPVASVEALVEVVRGARPVAGASVS